MKCKTDLLRKRLIDSDAGMYLCIALIAAVIFLRTYGVNILDPTYVDWLMTGSDLSQHYLGWLAYRASEWHFPIGMADTLAYPYETSIIFTDSIPIVAFFFKLLSPVLPDKFQYFGLWGIACFILQGIFAGRSIRSRTDSRPITVIASALFITAPVMIWRMYIHTALAGQWIIICALDMLLNPGKYQEKKKFYFSLVIIGFLSASIHLYFALINGIILTGYILIALFKEKRPRRCLFSLAAYLASVAFAVWIFGGFDSGMSAQNAGLGIFSFNLNNFVNPQGWSKLFKDLALYGDGQYEGFAYLGAGVILLILLAVYSCLINIASVKATVKDNGIQIIAIIVVCILAIVVAASPKVTIGEKVLAEFDLPKIITDIWSIFRASGRIIWVAVYLIMFSAILGLLRGGREKLSCFILSLILMLQVYDISDVINQKYANFKDKIKYQTVLATADLWSELANNKDIKHVLYYSSMDESSMYSLTDWALENEMTLNDFYFARSLSELVDKNREEILKKLPDDTIYIFSEDDKLACARYDLHYYNIDGMIVGCVNAINGFSEMSDREFTLDWIFSNDQYMLEGSGHDTEDGRILYPGGLSYGPYWRVPGGQYEIEIRGEGLLTGAELITCCNGGQTAVEHSEIFREDSTIRLNVKTEDDIDDFEILIRNVSENNIELSGICMRLAR